MLSATPNENFYVERYFVKFHPNFVSADYRSYLTELGPIDAFLLAEVEQKAASADAVVTSADAHGVATVHTLDWDSEIFGYQCARVGAIAVSDMYVSGVVEKIDHALKQSDTRFADVRIGLQHQDLIQEFVEHGWCIVDQLNVYFSELDELLSETRDEVYPYVVRDISPDYAEDFFKQNPKLFYGTRIYNDVNISADAAELFYTRLMEATCSNSTGPMCGVWDKNELVGIAVGEVDAKLSTFAKAPLASLWLIGLSERLRGQGLGKTLFHAFLEQCHQQGIKYLEISTQHDNYPANKLYASSGLSLESQLITLHHWYE